MASEEEKADEAAAEKLEAEYGVGLSLGEIIGIAAQLGDVPALRHFLGVDPDSVREKTGHLGQTPLHQAATEGQVEAAELLLSKGASVDAKDDRGDTPLHDAVTSGKVQIVELLLSKGAAVDAKNEDGITPLDLVRAEHDTEMEQLLLKASATKEPSAEDDRKAPVDSADNPSEEVKKAAQELKKAMESGNAQVLKEALDKAKSHKVSQEEVMEAMDKYIALLESADPAEPLTSEEADAAAAKECPGGLFGAAKNGHLPALRHFLRVDPRSAVHKKRPSDGKTPLHLAASNGHVEAAELLLSKKAAVNIKTNDGNTSLHLAAFNGHVDAAKLLLSKRAAVDAKTNDGKTPLDLASEQGKTEMVQLLNRPAKKPSAEHGKTPPDLSSKGKAEMKPLPRAADKTSEADKKAQQTPGFAFSSSSRLTSKEEHAAAAEECKAPVHSADNASEEVKKDAPHAAGSGAVAVKHQRESSKEAAKELQEAMDSGDAQVLKKAIDNAKLHKVSLEDVMKALEKYIALQEAVHRSATSPAKEGATSKAESSVKLEPGHGARLAMFSARFNEKNKDTEMKFRAVHQLLVENQYEILMVEAGAGKSFGDKTLKYLRRLGEEKGVMLAVCTSDYGEMTDSPYCTYYELQLAKEYKVDVLPLQVEDNWKPCPPCGEGHLDHSKSALDYIHAVFLPSIVRIDCRNKAVEEIASEIAATLRQP